MNTEPLVAPNVSPPPVDDPPAAESAQSSIDVLAPLPQAEPGPVGHRCDVLIADDTGASREILSALLRQFCPGVSIREARDGAGALTCWRRPQIDPPMRVVPISK